MEELIIVGLASGLGGMLLNEVIRRLHLFKRHHKPEERNAGLTRYQDWKDGK